MARRKPSQPAPGPVAAAPSEAAAAGRRDRLRTLVMALTLIVVGRLVYANSFAGRFLLDDALHIVQNPAIRQFPSPGTWLTSGDRRPLVTLSLAANYAAGGLTLWGYHAFNLAVHLAAALTLLGLVRRTLRTPGLVGCFGPAADGIAFAVALLWLVHPLNTQAVTYVIQRAESMMALFYLLTLYALVRSAGEGAREKVWWLLAVAACFAGMLTKEVMATAPVVALLFDRTFLAPSLPAALRRRWPLYAALLLPYVAVAFIGLGVLLQKGTSAGFGTESWTPLSYALAQPRVIVHYLRLALWPDALCFDYADWRPPLDAAGLASLAFLLLLVAATGVGLWRRRPAAFLPAFFLLVLGPTSSFMPIRDAAAEHRVYLPLAAVVASMVFAVVWAWRRVVAGKSAARLAIPLAGVLLVAAAVPLALTTVRRNNLYHSDIAMWQDVVRLRPFNWRGQNNLAVLLEEQRRWPEALGLYTRAIEIWPDYEGALCNRGGLLSKMGQFDEAMADLNRAIALAPNDVKAYNNRGLAYLASGRPAEAVADLDHVLQLEPGRASSLQNRGMAYAAMGRKEDALRDFTAALAAQPDLTVASLARSAALRDLGQPDEALAELERVLDRHPDHAEAALYRSMLLRSMGRNADAVRSLTALLQRGQVHPGFFVERALALAALGEFAQARADAAEAQRRGLAPPRELIEALKGEKVAN